MTALLKRMIPLWFALHFEWWSLIMEKMLLNEPDYQQAAKNILEKFRSSKSEYRVVLISDFIRWLKVNSPINTKPWLLEEVEKSKDLFGRWDYLNLRAQIGSPVPKESLVEEAREACIKKDYLFSAYLYATAGRLTQAEAVFALHDGMGFQPPIWQVADMIKSLKAKAVVE